MTGHCIELNAPILKDRLGQVLETVVHLDRQENFFGGYSRTPSSYQLNNMMNQPNGKAITSQSLVIGALETAFVDMVMPSNTQTINTGTRSLKSPQSKIDAHGNIGLNNTKAETCNFQLLTEVTSFGGTFIGEEFSCLSGFERPLSNKSTLS